MLLTPFFPEIYVLSSAKEIILYALTTLLLFYLYIQEWQVEFYLGVLAFQQMQLVSLKSACFFCFLSLSCGYYNTLYWIFILSSIVESESKVNKNKFTTVWTVTNWFLFFSNYEIKTNFMHHVTLGLINSLKVNFYKGYEYDWHLIRIFGTQIIYLLIIYKAKSFFSFSSEWYVCFKALCLMSVYESGP